MAAHGNRIILTPCFADPVEGYLASGETIYPGMIVQVDPTQSRVGGKWAWKIYDRGADGDHPAGPHIVVTEDLLQGKTIDDAYGTGSGTRLFGAIPRAGCELNLLFKNVSGTGDDVAAGDLFIVDDGTGKVIVTTGSPEEEVAMALDSITDPTADTLIWAMWGAGN